MVLKLTLPSMEQEFELNSLEENLKQPPLDGLNCCDPRGVEQHLLQQGYPPVELLCPAVAALPGNNNRRFEYHHTTQQQQQHFPPSPPSIAVSADANAAMQPDAGRTNLLMEESMMWLTTQPLDLRSNDIAEIDGWILRRGGYGDVLHGDQQHFELPPQQQPTHKLMNGCYDGGCSSGEDSLPDLPSSPGTIVDNPVATGGLNDDQLIKLSVRDLNRKLHGFPREVVTRIKQKRRTLKNRGYAQNCRTKRIALKCQLEKNNHALQADRDRLVREKDLERQLREKAVQERDRAIQERDYYKNQLKHQLSLVRSSRDFGGSLSSANASSPSSPEFYM